MYIMDVLDAKNTERKGGEFWSSSTDEMLQQLKTTKSGLTTTEAQNRLNQLGPNILRPKRTTGSIRIFVSQFSNPIILLLIATAIASFFLGSASNAIIILFIVLISGSLGFWQEHASNQVMQKLLAIVQVKVSVLRDGRQEEIPTDKIVPGDIVNLSAGSGVPADGLLLESKDLLVDEAALTGESFPVEKTVGQLQPGTAVGQRTNVVFMGTHVVSGEAKAVIVRTGTRTEFGKISEHLEKAVPETEFEHGVKRFGYFLMLVTLILVVAIFIINIVLRKPLLDSILFSMALAVGLTPELLPAIISVNLSHGARRMAEKKVIVRRLTSIENFGSMNILCCDKTGTLTEGTEQIGSIVNIDGKDSEKALLYSYLNASLETGFANPIDEALRNYRKLDISAFKRLDEVPYDFTRKRLTVLVSRDTQKLLITKGAPPNVLDICSKAETSEGRIVDISLVQDKIHQLLDDSHNHGFRTLVVAYRDVGSRTNIDKGDEKELVFLGLIEIFDPPKQGVAEIIQRMKQHQVSLKVITGDNRLVAAHVAKQVGLSSQQILTGPDIEAMAEKELMEKAKKVEVFAEIEPNQKEKIILALRKSGNVTGYLGDGINDAPALHAADVGISVNTAADVAKEAADIVLLEKDLGVLIDGAREGRTTFANTLKYVFMATSANFGNMFSMAGASLFLPFLPMLPTQILLTNLLTDVPEMTIATDRVDPELISKPRRWDIKFIRRFMITFGILSSIFDYSTFGVLIYILNANQDQFRTGWFVESVVSASIIVLVIRTRRPLFKSPPSKPLLISTIAVAIVTFLIPFTPLTRIFGFTQLPVYLLAIIIGIVILYVLAAEIVKLIFYRWTKL